jgi:hypothetical protein
MSVVGKNSHGQYVGIIDGAKLNITKVTWPLLAWYLTKFHENPEIWISSIRKNIPAWSWAFNYTARCSVLFSLYGKSEMK